MDDFRKKSLAAILKLHLKVKLNIVINKRQSSAWEPIQNSGYSG